MHCYVYRIDASHDRPDSSCCRKTANFSLPVQRNRQKEYKVEPGTLVYTCFTSDFFISDADDWRPEAWRMIKERSDCRFFFFTKRIDRMNECLPEDWGDGYDNVVIGCTVENQTMADRRLPVFLDLPIKHRTIGVEPMLEKIDISRYLSDKIESVSAGGESGAEARVCDFEWVRFLKDQCKRSRIAFSYHQTGARLLKDGRLYNIPRRLQHEQAKKARLDFSVGKPREYKALMLYEIDIGELPREFIAFDTETTGFEPELDRITELGAVRFVDGEPAEEFQMLINSHVSVPPVIEELTGISTAMVRSAAEEQIVFPAFRQFLGEAAEGKIPLVIHNAPFDLGFLDASFARLGLSAEIAYIDTLKAAKKLFPKEKHGQEQLAEKFGLVNERAHRALSDAAVCGKLALILNNSSDI